MKKFIIFVLILTSKLAQTQSFKFVKSEFQAKYRVYYTQNEKEANVIAYKVANYYDCIKPGYFYIAPIWFEDAIPLFKVTDKSKADILIYWTEDKTKAKWIN